MTRDEVLDNLREEIREHQEFITNSEEYSDFGTPIDSLLEANRELALKEAILEILERPLEDVSIYENALVIDALFLGNKHGHWEELTSIQSQLFTALGVEG